MWNSLTKKIELYSAIKRLRRRYYEMLDHPKPDSDRIKELDYYILYKDIQLNSLDMLREDFKALKEKLEKAKEDGLDTVEFKGKQVGLDYVEHLLEVNKDQFKPKRDKLAFKRQSCD